MRIADYFYCANLLFINWLYINDFNVFVNRDFYLHA